MTSFLPRARKATPFGFVRFLAFTLIVSLTLLLPAITEAVTVTVQAKGGGISNQYISIESFVDGSVFSLGSSTASVTVRVRNADGTDVADGTPVTWTVTRARNNSPAMYQGWGASKTGLNWGSSPRMVLSDDNPELTAPATSTTASGLAAISLTDIVGERVITIEAKVHLDNAEHTVSQAVSFGNGPLVKFMAPNATPRTWAEAYQLCNGFAPAGADDPSILDVGDDGDYHGGGKLPDIDELQAVSAVDTTWSYTNPNTSAQGAAIAAGWPGTWYWTGVALGTGSVGAVYVDDGEGRWYLVGNLFTVCRR